MEPCTPYAWRSTTRQLLCGNDADGAFRLVGLDGTSGQKVAFSGIPGQAIVPLAYIQEFDVLIVLATLVELGQERFELWAYSFRESRSERVARGLATAPSGVVWLSK
jgi:hypothetical protein